MQTVEMLGAGLLVVLLVGMVVGLRVRRRQRQADLQPTGAVRSDESMFVAAPPSSVDRVESPRDLGIPARRTSLSDRLVAGAIAGVLLGGIICTLEVTGFAGSAGAILARPMAAFPLFEDPESVRYSPEY
jgi:F0F1-type ATP synthase assembly protein I